MRANIIPTGRTAKQTGIDSYQHTRKQEGQDTGQYPCNITSGETGQMEDAFSKRPGTHTPTTG